MCRFALGGIALQKQPQQQFASKTKQTNKVQSSYWTRFGCTTMCGKPRDTGPGSLLAPFVSLSSSSALSPSLFTPQRPSFQDCETSSWLLCAQLYNLLLQWVHIGLVTCTLCKSRLYLTWVKTFKDVSGIAAFSEACFVNGSAACYTLQVTPRI